MVTVSENWQSTERSGLYLLACVHKKQDTKKSIGLRIAEETKRPNLFRNASFPVFILLTLISLCSDEHLSSMIRCRTKMGTVAVQQAEIWVLETSSKPTNTR